MPFLSRDLIDPALRAKYEGKYKAQLKTALHTPGLTAAQRDHLRSQIRGVGQAKVYTEDSQPKAGALSFPTYPPASEVRKMKKSELIQLANDIGLSTEGNKPDITKRILNVIT